MSQTDTYRQYESHLTRLKTWEVQLLSFRLFQDFLIVFQSQLLKLFPDIDSVKEHRVVLRFASGLSEKVGHFLVQYHVPPKHYTKDGTDHRMIWNILKENEFVPQDLFENLFETKSSVEQLFFFVNLNKAEIQSLSKAIQVGKLPHLKLLDLRTNVLTSCLKDLFGGPNHPGFPKLEKLYLVNTYLNLEDVESLSEAVRAGKLPGLKVLYLGNLYLENEVHVSQAELEVVEALIAACDAHYPGGLQVALWHNALRQGFPQRWRDKYRNVKNHVSLILLGDSGAE